MQIVKAVNFSSFQKWVKNVQTFFDHNLLRYDENFLQELEDPEIRKVAFIVADDTSKQYLVIFDSGNSPERKMAKNLEAITDDYHEFKERLRADRTK